MSTQGLAVFLLVATLGLQSENAVKNLLNEIGGQCQIAAGSTAGMFHLHLERELCDNRPCSDGKMDEPENAFKGITLADLGREGAHLEAVLESEAGRITCTGVVHELRLTGKFTFAPNRAFVAELQKMGFTNLTAEKLEVYTLFRIETDWIQSLKGAGVQGMNSDNVIGLKAFKVEPEYVRSFVSLGFPAPPADKLIALKGQGVNAAEVKEVRALGYKPTMDELIQMRVFHIDPEFIKRMQARGFDDLTISKLVQIKVFKLAD